MAGFNEALKQVRWIKTLPADFKPVHEISIFMKT